jgi:hypothetical protein
MLKRFEIGITNAAAGLALAGLTLGCAVEFEGDAPAALEDGVRSESSAIINGQVLTANSFNAAVWAWSHQHNNWFPRPCSGTILRRTATQTFVLTARHCLTRTDQPDAISGPLVGTTQLRVTTALTPGVRSASTSNTVVPAGDTPASISDFMSVVGEQSPESAHDVVLLAVNAVLPAVATPMPSHGRMGLIGIHRGPLSELPGETQRAWGYGRNQRGTAAQNGDPYWAGGAGTLRWGQGFEILSVQQGDHNSLGYRAGSYTYDNSYVGGAPSIFNGDSGGGSYLPFANSANGVLWMVQTGVHSVITGTTSGTHTAVSPVADWIQTQLKWLSLSPARYPQYRVYFGSVAENAAARWTTSTNDAGLYYQSSAKQLRPASSSSISSLCVQDLGGGGTSIRLKPCSSNNSAQRWTMLSDYRIKNDGTSKCLHQSREGSLVASDCTVTPERQFVWSAVQ